MGEQQIFVEFGAGLLVAGRELHFQRHAGQRRERLPVGGGEGQRNQRGTGVDQLVAELLGETVSEIRRADLGDRQAAGRDHERARR